MIAAIACIDDNFGIGYNNNLLEKFKPDMEHFKSITINNVVMMGRKTWESLGVNKLPNRQNIVITRNPNEYKNQEDLCFVNQNEAELMLELSQAADRDVFIIGGASIYSNLLDYCSDIFITRVFKTHENVDSYFPDIDKKEWELVDKSEILEYNDISYQFQHYCRFI